MAGLETSEIDVEAFYQRYAPMVLRRCRALLRDEERARDAMQEVFMKVLQQRQRLHGQYPSSLLYQIATNICLNVIRQQKTRRTDSGDDLLCTIACYDTSEQRLIASSLLDRIFQREADSTRQIAVMYHVDGMTLQAIAREVGLSLSGVRKRLAKVQRCVKQVQEEHHGQ